MDGSRFDALTRRGVALAAGGVTALLALTHFPGAKAKKNKKKCGKQDDPCNFNKKKCCCGFNCEPVNASGNFCCRAADFPADSAQDCCSGRLELGKCICKTIGQTCSASRECCSGFCDTTTNPDSCQAPPP